MADSFSLMAQPFLGNGDIFDWHAKFQSCVRYFLDVAQYTSPVQAVAAYVNIQLPFQRPHQILSSTQTIQTTSPSSVSPGPGGSPPPRPGVPVPAAYVSIVPYIRRLVATGFDVPGVLHGFFGDDWTQGVGPLQQAERQNYMFAAKSDTWSHVKADYDMEDGQTIPFMRPLNATEGEIENAEASWSEWLAMQDWMVGPRAPQTSHPRIKPEREC